jgi:hypothetical protein
MDSNIAPQARVTLPSPAVLLRTKVLLATNRLIAMYLSILEEIGTEHDEAIAKLRAALPPDQKPYADLICYFTEDKYDTLRSRVLRAANDARRELEETITILRLPE